MIPVGESAQIRTGRLAGVNGIVQGYDADSDRYQIAIEGGVTVTLSGAAVAPLVVGEIARDTGTLPREFGS